MYKYIYIIAALVLLACGLYVLVSHKIPTQDQPFSVPSRFVGKEEVLSPELETVKKQAIQMTGIGTGDMNAVSKAVSLVYVSSEYVVLGGVTPFQGLVVNLKQGVLVALPSLPPFEQMFVFPPYVVFVANDAVYKYKPGASDVELIAGSKLVSNESYVQQGISGPDGVGGTGIVARGNGTNFNISVFSSKEFSKNGAGSLLIRENLLSL